MDLVSTSSPSHGLADPAPLAGFQVSRTRSETPADMRRQNRRIRRQSRIQDSEAGRAMLMRARRIELEAAAAAAALVGQAGIGPVVLGNAWLPTRIGSGIYASPGFAVCDSIQAMVGLAQAGQGARCEPDKAFFHLGISLAVAHDIPDERLLQMLHRRMRMLVPMVDHHEYLIHVHHDTGHIHGHAALARTDLEGTVVHCTAPARRLRLLDDVEGLQSGRDRDVTPLFTARTRGNPWMKGREIGPITLAWLEHRSLAWTLRPADGGEVQVPVFTAEAWSRIAPEAGPEAISLYWGCQSAEKAITYVGRGRTGDRP